MSTVRESYADHFVSKKVVQFVPCFMFFSVLWFPHCSSCCIIVHHASHFVSRVALAIEYVDFLIFIISSFLVILLFIIVL